MKFEQRRETKDAKKDSSGLQTVRNLAACADFGSLTHRGCNLWSAVARYRFGLPWISSLDSNRPENMSDSTQKQVQRRYMAGDWKLDWYKKNKKSISAFANHSVGKEHIDSWTHSVGEAIDKFTFLF